MWQTVELIKDHSDKSQWHYISSKQNPADYASTGIDICHDDKVKRWYLGPQFLWEPEETWDDNKIIPPVNEKDPELKKEFAVCVATDSRCLDGSRKLNVRLIHDG